MPKTYRRKRSRTVTRSRRRKSRSRRKRVRRAFPRKMAVNLPYSEINISIGSGAGLGGGIIFSANGVFDPNITGTGHQPRGFDQYMLFYDHYVVIGSKITVDFQNNEDFPIRCGIALRDANSNTILDPDILGEYFYKRERTAGAVTSGQSNTTTVTYQASPRKFLGRSKVLSDSSLKGSSAANPAEQLYYYIYCFALDGSSAISSTDVRVKIDYATVFIEPKLGVGS